jgi:hypothetical protein
MIKHHQKNQHYQQLKSRESINYARKSVNLPWFTVSYKA